MSKEKKLFKITLAGTSQRVAFAVATSPDEAYEKVRKYLDKNDIGFAADREWETMEFIASEATNSRSTSKLFL